MPWFLYRCPECGRYFITRFSDCEKIECVDCGYEINYPTCLGIVGGVPVEVE